MNSLDGRTALVTGASRGIGASIARKLSENGARVILHCNRSADLLEKVAAEIRAKGGSTGTIRADLANPESVAPMFDRLATETLDIVVNNAGIFDGGPLEELGLDPIQRVLNVNVSSLILISREFARRTRTKHGRIINITSFAAQAPGRSASLYAASKAAVDALTRCWSFELGGRGITVNSVAPGFVETEMSSEHIGNSEAILRGVSLKRAGQPEDIADVVAFLASNESRWITGQVIAVNGGQLAAATILRSL
jgi:NAD(P)-dependent dehydrogenase (short-subunit alcohol dehydrogenase family)